MYLSGAGVANASFGLPDLGMTSLNDVCEDARRICARPTCRCWSTRTRVSAPRFTIARTTRELIRAGAAGMHLEDQVQAKRCGHRPARNWSPPLRWRTASGRGGRADRLGLRRHGAHRCACRRRPAERAIERAAAYVEAGADMIFAEALDDARRISRVHATRSTCRCSPTSPSSDARRFSRRPSCGRPESGWCSTRSRRSAP